MVVLLLNGLFFNAWEFQRNPNFLLNQEHLKLNTCIAELSVYAVHSLVSDCFNIIYLSQFLHDNLLNIFYTDVVVKMEPVDEETTINQG